MAHARRTFLKTAIAPLAPLAAAAPRGGDPSIVRSVEAIPARVPYRSTFVLGRGLVATGGQAGTYIYVRMQSAGGHVGWGETIALPNWSYETVESIVSTIEKHLAPLVIGRSAWDQAWFQKQFDDKLTPAVSQGFPFAKSAVLMAALDVAGQAAGLPLHRLLGGKTRDKVELSYALSIDEPGKMAEVAKAFEGVKCFKVKVAGEPKADIARVLAVAKARPDVDIWIDANQSYRPVHLETFVKAIDGMPEVRCLEQPVKSTDWLGMQRARRSTKLPLAIDEGCFSSYDVARIAGMQACDLVVLKAAKSGGILNCLKSAAVADAHGLGLLGSGLTEAGIGLAASIHMYSTIDVLLPPELNGPKFLVDLMVDGLAIEGNTVTVPDAPGLGVRVREDVIRSRAMRL